MIKVDSLIWDNWNTKHIARHNVMRDEVEQACQGIHVVYETHNERLLLIGQTKKGRVLAVVLFERNPREFFVVTARSADRKERRIYREQTQQGGENAA